MCSLAAFAYVAWPSVTTEAVTSMPWASMQPDNPDLQNCGVIPDATGMDNDFCDRLFTYVCECDAYADDLVVSPN